MKAPGWKEGKTHGDSGQYARQNIEVDESVRVASAEDVGRDEVALRQLWSGPSEDQRGQRKYEDDFESEHLERSVWMKECGVCCS